MTTTAEFKRLVGVDQDAAIELVPPAAQPFTPAAGDARDNRPERKSLLFRIDAAEERVEAASAGKLPQLNASAGYDMSRPNPRIFPIQTSGNRRGHRCERSLSLFDGDASDGAQPAIAHLV